MARGNIFDPGSFKRFAIKIDGKGICEPLNKTEINKLKKELKLLLNEQKNKQMQN